MSLSRQVKVAVCATLLLLRLGGAHPHAQGAHVHGQDHAAQAPEGWRWIWDGNAFVGWNYQKRKFTDFDVIESQNWAMGRVERRAGQNVFGATLMLSLEPFTMKAIGSPQAFQTGETFKQAPLIDYQHPHDLFMALGVDFQKPMRGITTTFEGALVGSPSIGPTPFMHRPSAADNPQVPLSHHQLDATHITDGVVRAGAERGGFGVDGSWFHGAEPDENRTDLDLGRLDSWALRARFRRGPWDAQVSKAYLTTPEWVEPFNDVIRLTASVAYTAGDGALASLLAWGQNREIHGKLDAYLFETTARLVPRTSVYTRLELVTKDILGAGGRHPRGFQHYHPLSRVAAFTVGAVRNLTSTNAGSVGVGGDITVDRTPPNLDSNYGTPLSFHVFVRYRASGIRPNP